MGELKKLEHPIGYGKEFTYAIRIKDIYLCIKQYCFRLQLFIFKLLQKQLQSSNILQQKTDSYV